MIKVGHFSDLHYCEKNLEESDRCFGFAVEQAIQRGIDVAVISGDATDHALDVHNPAVVRLARRVLQLANHCPVLMLQGTFSHEPPGTLAIFPLLGGRHPIHVADRISQVSLTAKGEWSASEGWRFEHVDADARVLFTCVPTVNKAAVAAVVGAADAAEAHGQELAALLAGYARVNGRARELGVPTIGVSHGTVAGCVTEHGVPMAGFDHEFTTASLFSAQAQAFMLGHIHRHQQWAQGGQRIAYAGSIGRFHHGEQGDKGFLVWEVDPMAAGCELVVVPARRTVDLFFDGKPDLEQIQAAVQQQGLQGAHVRVRWSVADEDRHEVDRDAIRRALDGAADVQLEGRVIPVVRSRAAGISRCASLAAKVAAWCEVSAVAPGPLLERLDALACDEPSDIAAGILGAGQGAAPDRAPAVVDRAETLELF